MFIFAHSPISTFKSYISSAFDNYDVILCQSLSKEGNKTSRGFDVKKKRIS